MLDQRQLALDPSVRNRAHLLGVEFWPPLPVEILHQRWNCMRARHIDERVAHIALVLEVDGQVEKVKWERVRSRKPLLQQ